MSTQVIDGIVISDKKPASCEGCDWQSVDRTCLSKYGCMKV